MTEPGLRFLDIPEIEEAGRHFRLAIVVDTDRLLCLTGTQLVDRVISRASSM